MKWVLVADPMIRKVCVWNGAPVGGYCNSTDCGTSHIAAWQYPENCPTNICLASDGSYTAPCVDLDEVNPGTQMCCGWRSYIHPVVRFRLHRATG